MTPADDPLQTRRPERRQAAWTDVALVLSVIACAGWQPTPGENEAHYLALARHYWQPAWCARDALLESAAIHQLFYALFGWTTVMFSMPTAAWIGRLVSWSLLAIAWRRLSFAVAPMWGLAPLSAAVLAVANRHGHLSGEWLIGGIEAKTLAYPAVFAALAAWLEGRPRPALVWFGLSTAMHPLVGGWALVAWGLSLWFCNGLAGLRPLAAWATVVAAALIGFGVAPPLWADWGTPASVRADAWRILVFDRVPHHLLPWAFGAAEWWWFAGLLAVTVFLGFLAWGNAPLRKLVAFTAPSLALAAVGGILAFTLQSWPSTQAAFLRFYWFRQIGMTVPMLAALSTVAVLYGRWSGGPPRRWGATLLTAAVILVALHLPRINRVPEAERPTPPDQFAAWVDVCRWVQGHTPADSLFITPRLRQTFKWYAQRAEAANWKDVPQDAAHVVTWWQRLVELHSVPTPSGRQWVRSLTQHSAQRLRELGNSCGADYVVCAAEPRKELPCDYRNEFYAVYRLSDETPASENQPRADAP